MDDNGNTSNIVHSRSCERVGMFFLLIVVMCLLNRLSDQKLPRCHANDPQADQSTLASCIGMDGAMSFNVLSLELSQSASPLQGTAKKYLLNSPRGAHSAVASVALDIWRLKNLLSAVVPIYLSICLSVCLPSCLSIDLSAIYLSICLFIYLSICLSVCLPSCLSIDLSAIYLSICLSIYLSVCLAVCLAVYLSIYLLSICLSVYLSVCLSVCLAVYLSIYLLSICLSVYLSIYLPVYCLSICMQIPSVAVVPLSTTGRSWNTKTLSLEYLRYTPQSTWMFPDQPMAWISGLKHFLIMCLCAVCLAPLQKPRQTRTTKTRWLLTLANCSIPASGLVVEVLHTHCARYLNLDQIKSISRSHWSPGKKDISMHLGCQNKPGCQNHGP